MLVRRFEFSISVARQKWFILHGRRRVTPIMMGQTLRLIPLPLFLLRPRTNWTKTRDYVSEQTPLSFVVYQLYRQTSVREPLLLEGDKILLDVQDDPSLPDPRVLRSQIRNLRSRHFTRRIRQVVSTTHTGECNVLRHFPTETRTLCTFDINNRCLCVRLRLA